MAICIIPARGNSRRIPGKNIKLFHGRPIISYSINTAKESGLFDRIVVSTDDHDIADVAMQYGAEVHWRDADSARDEVGTQEVAARVLEALGITDGECCLLYATCPMLAWETLTYAIDQLRDSEVDYIVPVATWLSDPGQFYFGTVVAFMQRYPLISPWTSLIQIPPETAIDINTMDDWTKAEQMYAALHNLEGI